MTRRIAQLYAANQVRVPANPARPSSQNKKNPNKNIFFFYATFFNKHTYFISVVNPAGTFSRIQNDLLLIWQEWNSR